MKQRYRTYKKELINWIINPILELKKLRFSTLLGLILISINANASLQLHYTFKNIAPDSSIIYDETGNGYNGFLKNDAKLKKLGTYGVLYLGRGDGYMEFASKVGDLINTLTDFTIASCIYIDNETDITLNGNFIWNFGNSDNMAADNNGCMFFNANGTRYSITQTNWTGEKTVRQNVGFTKGEWVHFAYTQSGNNGAIYINGISVANGRINIKPQSLGKTTNNYIGKSAYSSDAYMVNTLYSDFRIYNNVLSGTEISNLVATTTSLTNLFATVKATWFKPALNLTTSNLPIVILNTESIILNEPKTSGWMKIIRNKDSINTVTDTANIYDGYMGIEIRGSYSATLPQKSYGFETQDSLGNNNNVKLIGMPKENDWILLANYNDKSFLRNSLPYKLFREMGNYAARTRHCEVIINNSYEGIYVLTEKLKRDSKRIDIAKLDIDDNAGDSVTGGYIFKIDYFTDADSWLSNYHPIDRPTANVHFVYHDPAPDELTDEQKLYIQTYVDEFESVLYGDSYNDIETGYHQYINVTSFTDYFILSELARNVDAYKKSRYFFKDKDSKGGLINSGPIWDFDWAWKNINDGCGIFRNLDGSGWAYKVNGECTVSPSPAGWMVKLMEDTTFQNTLGTRYHTLRESVLSEAYLNNYIDSIATLLQMPQERHYTRWPILGKAAGAGELDGYANTYTEEIEKMRSWIELRLAWLDKNMPEMKEVTPPDSLPDGITNFKKANIRIFPNPSPDFCFVESDRKIASITVYTPTGGLKFEAPNLTRYYLKIETRNFDTGIYLLKVKHTDGSEYTKKIIVKRN